MIQEEAVRNTGIKPDVEAPDDERQQDFLVQSFYDSQEDLERYRQYQERVRREQMERAIKVLMKGIVPARRAA